MLKQMPTILADNEVFDLSDFVMKLRAAHCEGQVVLGLVSR